MARATFPEFGKRLCEVMSTRGITNQSAFALKLGVTSTKISRWRNGAMPESQDDLQRLGTALGVDWQWLLVGDWSARTAQIGLASESQTFPPPESLTVPEWREAMNEATFREVWRRVGLVWKHREERPVQWDALVKNVHAFSLGLEDPPPPAAGERGDPDTGPRQPDISIGERASGKARRR